ncbi:phosphoadenosine phosphosulfate reductase domain-containing protein [Paenibacillus sp. CAU 1782]
METVNVVNKSGGKDSTATWLKALEDGIKPLVVFNDTGNEHPLTYEYLEYLESNLGPIKRINADFSQQIERKRETVQTKWRNDGIGEDVIQAALEMLHPTGNPFLDLCIWKGRFPSTKIRFCTVELKVRPMFDQVFEPLLDEGKHVVSWQGIRATESRERALMPEREDTPEGYEIYRPLLQWSAKDVFDMHRKHGIEPNPLYKLGMGRVGCMPCINCGKDELFEIARRFPDQIARIAEWERIVKQASKRGGATFFPTANGRDAEGIYDNVEWSKTAYGGRNYDLIKSIEFEEVPSCSSQYGLCE